MRGYSAIRRKCLHIVCYSYYVRTLLNIRCEKHYSYYKISCLHFTGITTNLTGMRFFFPVGQIRFKWKFNIHVCHLEKKKKKKKTNTPESDGSYVLNVLLITHCWCCTNSKRGSGSLDGPQWLVSHSYTVFNSVIEELKYLFRFLSFVQPGLLCIETWNLWNEVEK